MDCRAEDKETAEAKDAEVHAASSAARNLEHGTVMADFPFRLGNMVYPEVFMGPDSLKGL